MRTVRGAAGDGVTRTVVVDAVYSWMLDVPAIVTFALSNASGVSAMAAGRAASDMLIATTAAAYQPKRYRRVI